VLYSTKMPGQIQIIFGPMFSGKSTELLRRIRRYTIANRSCMVVKYRKDTRYSEDHMATHDKQMWFETKPTDKLDELLDIAKTVEVIGIDEGQFFPDLVPFCEAMANEGKVVIVAALDGTFQRKPFGNVLELIPLAETVTKLNAVCMLCFKDAAFTKRLGSETQIEVIGGADKYIAVCRSCFNSSTNNACQSLSPRNSQATPKKQRKEHLSQEHVMDPEQKQTNSVHKTT